MVKWYWFELDCFLTDLESLVSQEYHSTTASTQTGIYHATMFGVIKEAIRAKDQFAYKRLLIHLK